MDYLFRTCRHAQSSVGFVVRYHAKYSYKPELAFSSDGSPHYFYQVMVNPFCTFCGFRLIPVQDVMNVYKGMAMFHHEKFRLPAWKDDLILIGFFPRQIWRSFSICDNGTTFVMNRYGENTVRVGKGCFHTQLRVLASASDGSIFSLRPYENEMYYTWNQAHYPGEIQEIQPTALALCDECGMLAYLVRPSDVPVIPCPKNPDVSWNLVRS